MRTRRKLPWALLTLAAITAALLLVGPAFAGEFAEGEIYRLEAGQVVEDDLVVTASEVYIDGTVQGDLVAFGSYVEVNGTVQGDLMAAAGEVRINGTVQDDARVAGAGVHLSGSVGDDLYAAAGGGSSSFDVSAMAGRSVQQGLRIEPGASVGGAAYLGGGDIFVGGAVEEELAVGGLSATLAGPVGGDAYLDIGERLTVTSAAQIQGELAYTADREFTIPPGAAADIRFEQRPVEPASTAPGQNPAELYGWRVARLALVVLGFSLLGWLLLRFAPVSLRRPAEALAARPGQAILYGIAALAVLFLVPILSGLVVLAVVLFWGWFPAVMLAVLLTAALVLAWTLSPLITGLWLGRLVWPAKDRGNSDLVALVAGALLVVLAGALPWVGWIVGLVSLAFALGGLMLAARGSYDVPAPTVTSAPAPA
jgi:cytoskeletal protein CcmA (bactofilin family)